ncbi:neuromedin-S [Trichechus inunguis]
MERFLPQLPSILAVYCFCMLPTPCSGFPQPLSDPPDGLDIVQLEFLFHYSGSQEPPHPVKTGFPPAHPLMHLAAKLADRGMRRFRRRDSGAAVVDFTKKDYAATLGRPFFLFRPRNGRNTEDNVQETFPKLFVGVLSSVMR